MNKIQFPREDHFKDSNLHYQYFWSMWPNFEKVQNSSM